MKKFPIALAAAICAAFPTMAYEVGELVPMNPNINMKILSKVDSKTYSCSLLANPDNRPTGDDFHIPWSIQKGDVNFECREIAYEGFKGCDFTKVTISSSITHIGGGAFRNCTNLESVENGKDIVVIGNGAFEGCTALNSISLPSAELIGDWSFQRSGIKTFSLPSARTIGAGAFQECENLETAVLGEEVYSVGGVAFCNCHNLKYVTMPLSLREIGPTAFAFCLSLADIVLPRNLTTVGRDAFDGGCQKRIWVLTDHFMEFAYLSGILENRTMLEGLYCIPEVMDDVTSYIEAANESENSPVTKVLPKNINEAVVRASVGSTMAPFPVYLEYVMSGISSMKVYSEDGENPVQPMYGAYQIYTDKMMLDYNIDTYNHLNYFVDLLPSTSTISTVDAQDTPSYSVVYDLAGRSVDLSTAPSGIYIRDGKKIMK